jgi:hypothetical protein
MNGLIWLVCGILLLLSSKAFRPVAYHRQIFPSMLSEVAVPRLTARKAATIEPTILRTISTITAIKNRPLSKSTVLTNIRTSFCLKCHSTIHSCIQWVRCTNCRRKRAF